MNDCFGFREKSIKKICRWNFILSNLYFARNSKVNLTWFRHLIFLHISTISVLRFQWHSMHLKHTKAKPQISPTMNNKAHMTRSNLRRKYIGKVQVIVKDIAQGLIGLQKSLPGQCETCRFYEDWQRIVQQLHLSRTWGKSKSLDFQYSKQDKKWRVSSQQLITCRATKSMASWEECHSFHGLLADLEISERVVVSRHYLFFLRTRLLRRKHRRFGLKAREDFCVRPPFSRRKAVRTTTNYVSSPMKFNTL